MTAAACAAALLARDSREAEPFVTLYASYARLLTKSRRPPPALLSSSAASAVSVDTDLRDLVMDTYVREARSVKDAEAARSRIEKALDDERIIDQALRESKEQRAALSNSFDALHASYERIKSETHIGQVTRPALVQEIISAKAALTSDEAEVAMLMKRLMAASAPPATPSAPLRSPHSSTYLPSSPPSPFPPHYLTRSISMSQPAPCTAPSSLSSSTSLPGVNAAFPSMSAPRPPPDALPLPPLPSPDVLSTLLAPQRPSELALSSLPRTFRACVAGARHNSYLVTGPNGAVYSGFQALEWDFVQVANMTYVLRNPLNDTCISAEMKLFGVGELSTRVSFKNAHTYERWVVCALPFPPSAPNSAPAPQRFALRSYHNTFLTLTTGGAASARAKSIAADEELRFVQLPRPSA